MVPWNSTKLWWVSNNQGFGDELWMVVDIGCTQLDPMIQIWAAFDHLLIHRWTPKGSRQKKTHTLPEFEHSPWKMMVGRLLSFWDGIFPGAMSNFQGVHAINIETIELVACRSLHSLWPWCDMFNTNDESLKLVSQDLGTRREAQFSRQGIDSDQNPNITQLPSFT